MTTLVIASNLGGGIARHLELVGSVVPVQVRDLGEDSSLPAKVGALRAMLPFESGSLLVSHGVAAAVAARHRGRRWRRLRHVEFWHGDPFFLTPGRRRAYRPIARLGQAPDLQVFTHRWLVPRYADSRCEVEVLPNTVPVGPVSPASAEPVRKAVFLGRLSREKGLEDLLAAWPVDSLARGWRLDVHGTGPLVLDTGISGVTWRGAATNPIDVLARADLVVIPSWTETGPYTACEAMSVGTPFVGTRTGDMPEFVSSGCGWAVPPRDVAALRHALLAAQSASAADLAARGSAGREWLLLKRPYVRWAESVERIYARE